MEATQENSTNLKIEGVRQLESVPAEVELYYKRIDLFPTMPIKGWKESGDKELCEALGFTIAPQNARELGYETKKLSYALRAYGRSDFTPIVFRAYDGTRFGALYRKGVAGANYKEGDINTLPLIPMGNDAGLADKDITTVEAAISRTLHEKGLRVRLPVAAFSVTKVLTSDGVKTIDELIHSGILSGAYTENPPMLSVWATRNPTTFRDVFQAQDTSLLLKGQSQFLKLEGSHETQRVARLIDEGKGEKEWFNWLTTLAGEQMGKSCDVGFIHPDFHDQNVNLSIQSSDLGDDRSLHEPIDEHTPDSLKSLQAINVLSMLSYICMTKEIFNQTNDRYPAAGFNQIIKNYFRNFFKSEHTRYITDDLIRENQNLTLYGVLVENKENISRILNYHKLISILQDKIRSPLSLRKRESIVI